MARKSKKKHLKKSVADSVLDFAEAAWPYLERVVVDIVSEVVRAMPQLREPKKRAKKQAQR